MRILLTTILLLAMDLVPIYMSISISAEDLDGSEYDLDSSGSGSGDWSEQDAREIQKIKDDPINNDDDRIVAVKAKSDTRNKLHGDSYLIYITPWKADGTGSAKSKSFLENKDILIGIITGGVTGLTLAVAVAAIIIYKWKRRDVEGYVLGQQRI
ncbi:syndecan-4-like [Polymixia lowei]